MIREFGEFDPAANYVLRPGGYAVAIDHDRRIGVVRTPLGFFLPGGGQGSGETPEAAAVRESREECGLVLILKQQIGMADELVFAADEGCHYRKRCHFFLAGVVDRLETVEPDHELVWLPTAVAATTLLHQSQRWAVSESCLRDLLFHS